MSKPVITVENLSKSFTLQHQQPEGGYLALRDLLADKVKSVFKPGKNRSPATELFWALKDVSFEVQQGDRIGIIGRNGAGKSTLLKILSRIVAPTRGKITIEGRVASLLEVGTGFHPELTGRENIFLNGAILGMNKAEIKSKFDEIVDFSGVEKFLDTPVKRFSSGMYVRLAFAVAAHLEPEILIIDEVLAVGDAEFQKKCLGKMEDVSKSGRTILFVSHNMGAIQNLCNVGILMQQGEIAKVGQINAVVGQYNSGIFGKITNEKFALSSNKLIQFSEITLLNSDDVNIFHTDEEIGVELKIIVEGSAIDISLLLFINWAEGQKRITMIEVPLELKGGPKNRTIKIMIPRDFLLPGRYFCEIGLLNLINGYYDYKTEVGHFEVIYRNSDYVKFGSREIGFVFPPKYLTEID